MTDAPAPEPDRIEGAPHPRETQVLLGQDAAQTEFLDAYTTGRLHHGWLITGPRGVGKATLAWRIAQFLLATPMDDGGMFAPATPKHLEIDPEHPVARRLLAGSEPGLLVLRRPVNEKTGKLRAEITVEEVRKLRSFFGLSATDGGRRVVLVDAADELNKSAANALLKVLEEPPKNATLLLIAHQPSRLLPTIRSRCRVLRCAPLAPDLMAQAIEATGATPEAPGVLAALAQGSVGDALRLTHLGGAEIYASLIAMFNDLPRLDRGRVRALADMAAARGAEARYGLILDLFDLFLARVARAGAAGAPDVQAVQGEALLLQRLSADAHAARQWAKLHHDLGARARHGRAVNLDPASLILDMTLKIEQQAADLLR